jgi:hypothetical protein
LGSSSFFVRAAKKARKDPQGLECFWKPATGETPGRITRLENRSSSSSKRNKQTKESNTSQYLALFEANSYTPLWALDAI